MHAGRAASGPSSLNAPEITGALQCAGALRCSRRPAAGTPDDDEVERRKRSARAPDAVWATELPTDLWKRCLDFAYGPATACVDPLAPLKAAATLATVSRGTQRAMADPGLWKDLARGSERCGCDKIVLAADVGGFRRAARAAVARPRPRAARLFEASAPTAAPSRRRSACRSACASAARARRSGPGAR